MLIFSNVLSWDLTGKFDCQLVLKLKAYCRSYNLARFTSDLYCWLGFSSKNSSYEIKMWYLEMPTGHLQSFTRPNRQPFWILRLFFQVQRSHLNCPTRASRRVLCQPLGLLWRPTELVVRDHVRRGHCSLGGGCGFARRNSESDSQPYFGHFHSSYNFRHRWNVGLLR